MKYRIKWKTEYDIGYTQSPISEPVNKNCCHI